MTDVRGKELTKPEELTEPTLVDAAAEPIVVRQFGRYELRQELGHGATGRVFEAFDRKTNGIVALKTLISMDAESLFRLKHEFRSLANLEHPNFVRFGELSCEAGQWFFTMERVYGTDFIGYVRRPAPDGQGPRDDPTAQTSGVRARSGRGDGLETDEGRLRHALAQLVEALSVLHEGGRIHRDVKPSNVLVTTEGRVVLLDFGLITGFGSEAEMSGTPAYMPPEQIGGDKLTPAADFYAVGVMLFAALKGELPFRGKTNEILQAKLMEEAPTDLGLLAPEDLRALCLALLVREPSARPTIEGIRARLGLVAPAAPAREVFVGRETELGQLRQALALAQAGGTRAVVVRGECGRLIRGGRHRHDCTDGRRPLGECRGD
jgi:serine/threonine protein kinase